MNPTPQQLNTLRHMLGINTPSEDKPQLYRNYAAVNPEDEEFIELAELGLIQKDRSADSETAYDWYSCTEKGKQLAMNSFKDIQYSAARRRYLKYLSLRELFPDLTFYEYLTNKEFRDSISNGGEGS